MHVHAEFTDWRAALSRRALGASTEVGASSSVDVFVSRVGGNLHVSTGKVDTHYSKSLESAQQ